MINLSKPLIPKAVGGSAINPYGVAFATGGGQAWGLGGFPSPSANPDVLNQPNYALGNASVAQIGANTLNRLGSEWMGGFPAPNPVASANGMAAAPAQNTLQRHQEAAQSGGDDQTARYYQRQYIKGNNQQRAALSQRLASRIDASTGAPVSGLSSGGLVSGNLNARAPITFRNSLSNWAPY